MDHPNHITNHEKGKHLTFEDYVIIELRLKDGWKPNAIAKKELHCAPNTVRNIIKKGMTPLYNGKVFRFKAKTAWNAYQENRSRSCRTYEALEKHPFKATCFAGGYPLLFQIFWLRDSQGQVDGLLT